MWRAATAAGDDPDGTVRLVLDDGTPARATPDALAGSPFRRLSPGQRVLVTIDAATGDVAAVRPVANAD